MRYFLLFFLLMFFGCASPKEKEQIRIFESTLGNEYVKVLNQLVDDFEKKLKKQYPELDQKEAYKQYLLDISNTDLEDTSKFLFISNTTSKLFRKSGFWNDIYSESYSKDLFAKDSTKLDSTKHINVNNVGNYMMALHRIKDSDSVINHYYKKREAAGILPNKLFVDGLLSNKPDFDNYIHKRIVVIEYSF